MAECHSEAIYRPNAEKTYSFTQETFSEYLAHAHCVLEATLPRENKNVCTRTVRLTTDFSRARWKVRDRSTFFTTERGLETAFTEEHCISLLGPRGAQKQNGCLPSLPHPLDPAPLPLLHLTLHTVVFSTQGAVLAVTDLTQTHHSLFKAEEVKTRPRYFNASIYKYSIPEL